jgi:hypothetical protein
VRKAKKEESMPRGHDANSERKEKNIHSHPNDAYTFQHRVPEYSTSRKATLAMDIEEGRERKDEL